MATPLHMEYLMDKSSPRYKKLLETSRAWKQANPERHAELARAYRSRNPEKTKAQNQLNYALRKGEISRKNCEVCGTSERVHAHHEDYTKPLEVKWLCYTCHKAAHPVTSDNKVVKFERAQKARLFGEKNPFCKLTDDNVKTVRHLLDLGFSQENIAVRFCVSQAQISRIKHSRSRSEGF